MTPMRIGLVIEHFNPRRGGAEHWTGRLASWLLAEGHEVHVVCQTATATDSGLMVHCLGRTKSRLAFADVAEQSLRRLTLDVVHDMGAGWFGDILQSHDGSRLAQWDRKLMMLPPWQRPFKRQLVKWLPRYGEFRTLMARQFSDPKRIVIAMSQGMADDYRRYHGVPASRIRVIHHGVDTARYSPEQRDIHRPTTRQALGYAENEVVLLLAAHNFALKGLVTLIHALKRLHATTASPFRVAVLGGGRPRRFRRLARQCAVEHAVRFLGPTDDPLPYYAAADVYVQPTFYDAFGLTVLEAAACGLPVIASRAAGVSELFIDGKNGCLLSDPADDAALAETLRPLADPVVRQTLGSAARRLAQQHTFADNCQRIAAVYREVVDRRRRDS